MQSSGLQNYLWTLEISYFYNVKDIMYKAGYQYMYS
jgi:hypothetical protein